MLNGQNDKAVELKLHEHWWWTGLICPLPGTRLLWMKWVPIDGVLTTVQEEIILENHVTIVTDKTRQDKES